MSVLADLGACYRWARQYEGASVLLTHGDLGCAVSLRRPLDGGGCGTTERATTLALALVPAGQWARADMTRAAKAKAKAKRRAPR